MIEITSQMRVEFREKGYLVIPDFIDEEMVRQGQSIVRNMIDKHEPHWRGSAGIHSTGELLVSKVGRSPLLDHPARQFYDRSGIKDVADQLFRRELPCEEPDIVQPVATAPPFAMTPTPHIDGFVEGRELPYTFSLLASIILSSQESGNDGGLFVWPGSHLKIGGYVRSHGIDTLRLALHEDIGLADPVQITASAGSLVLAHYLLGHCAGQHTGERPGYAERLYYRLKAAGHSGRRKDTIGEPLLEYA